MEIENPFDRLKNLKKEAEILENQIDEYIAMKSINLKSNVLHDVTFFTHPYKDELVTFSLNDNTYSLKRFPLDIDVLGRRLGAEIAEIIKTELLNLS